MSSALSPNGGSVSERQRLHDRFGPCISVRDDYSRKIVSYQGNKHEPGLRWMKYKEGFSRTLVSTLIDEHEAKDVLDPFSGIGTTALVAAGQGKSGTGIEIMPIGVMAGKAIAEASNGLSVSKFSREASKLLDFIQGEKHQYDDYLFPHVRITKGAFPEDTERKIAAARHYISNVKNKGHQDLLNLACISVLEEVSYTRKDGQYLRWDARAKRPLRGRIKRNIGPIPSFSEALEKRLSEMVEDIGTLKLEYGHGYPELIVGSSLEVLKDFPSDSFDMVITSPPYANRYDYTRTYALELAWLGVDQQGFSSLRQQMLSATVENKTKTAWLDELYQSERGTLDRAVHAHSTQGALNEVLQILRDHADELSNVNVIRLVENYFLEMAVIVSELGRIVRPGGTVIMVNDNVQYHGEELPVDFILSDFAEQSGFECTNIWKLARGKGNSSQQMARFGRQELRKCVYKWVKRSG